MYWGWEEGLPSAQLPPALPKAEPLSRAHLLPPRGRLTGEVERQWPSSPPGKQRVWVPTFRLRERRGTRVKAEEREGRKKPHSHTHAHQTQRATQPATPAGSLHRDRSFVSGRWAFLGLFFLSLLVFLQKAHTAPVIKIMLKLVGMPVHPEASFCPLPSPCCILTHPSLQEFLPETQHHAHPPASGWGRAAHCLHSTTCQLALALRELMVSGGGGCLCLGGPNL